MSAWTLATALLAWVWVMPAKMRQPAARKALTDVMAASLETLALGSSGAGADVRPLSCSRAGRFLSKRGIDGIVVSSFGYWFAR